MSTPPKEQSAHTPSKGAVTTPNKWPSRELFRHSVTLVVGKHKKPYILHKDLLCFYSDFFRAAFNGAFQEATERKIELPDVEEEVFEYFQLWLYTRKLEFTTIVCPTVVKLWIFGDQHQIPLLQNDVVDGLFEKRSKQNQFTSRVIPLAYDKTLTGSPLRRAVIDIASSVELQDKPGARNLLRAERQSDWSVESLIDLVRAVDARDKALPQWSSPIRDKCYYHVHGKDEQCPK